MELATTKTTKKKAKSVSNKKAWSGVICLLVIIALFGYLGHVMTMECMLKTVMNTAHNLLLKICFYLMAVCVLTGAIGKLFVEFGVVDLLERLLRPLMKPLFNLPGVASLGCVMTFLSDNPAIISLAHDKHFSSYFKKYQYISLTNFGTAFGMGLLVIVFMVGQGYMWEPFVGLFGAFCGCIVSTRLMQRFVLKAYPNYAEELVDGCDPQAVKKEEEKEKGDHGTFIRTINSLLDGGKSGVEVGMQIIPGVLIITTLVLMLTKGPGEHGYTGEADQGVALLPFLFDKINVVFQWLFGFNHPELIAFPITALGSVGAALGLVDGFNSQHLIDGNAIAVFTAIGMCWSGYLSTHTAMLDAIGFRNLTGKAIISHTIGGLFAAIVAHLTYSLITLFF